jgi:hypothetical protein
LRLGRERIAAACPVILCCGPAAEPAHLRLTVPGATVPGATVPATNASLRVVEAPEKAGFVVRKRWQSSLLTFLMVFGPGLIMMEADNDAGAVSKWPASSMECDEQHAI